MKVVPGNGNPVLQPTSVSSVGHQPTLSGDQGQRPVLRRVDSRGGFPPAQYRPPGPYINQQPPVQQAPVTVRPPQPRPQPPPGAHFAPRPPPAPINQQRYPPPQRYAPPDNLTQSNPPPDIYRRPINTLPEGQTTQRPPTPQRPPQPPAPLTTTTRPPAVTQQRSFPSPPPQSPVQTSGSFDQGYKKSYILDPSESNLSHEQNGSNKPNISQIKNQSFSQSKNSDLNSSQEKLYRTDEYRSSSSLGFVQDPEKDVDTTALNGKTSSHEDITERPDSRAGLVKEQTNMHKIDEDDDDSVITPSRVNLTGIVRSITGSNDSLSQKSIDLNEPIKQIKNINPEMKQAYIFNPEMKQTSGYIQETKPILSKPQESQPQIIKYPPITKSNVMPEIKQHIYPQPYSHNTEHLTKLEPSDNKYMKTYEQDYQKYDNDVITAPMRAITPEPHRIVSHEKPTTLQTVKKQVSIEKQYQSPNWAVNKQERIKTPESGKNKLLSPTSPATPRNKMDKRVLSPRTEMSINNYLNRRSASAKFHRPGAV